MLETTVNADPTHPTGRFCTFCNSAIGQPHEPTCPHSRSFDPVREPQNRLFTDPPAFGPVELELDCFAVRRLAKFPLFAAVLDELRGLGKFKGTVTLTLSAARNPVNRPVPYCRDVEREISCSLKITARVKGYKRQPPSPEAANGGQTPAPLSE